MFKHGGAQYTAKQVAQSKRKAGKSRADQTFGGFKKHRKRLKCFHSMANYISHV
jgi:hypothetical protein